MYIIIILNCIKIFDPTKMTRNCLFNIYFHVDRYHIHNAFIYDYTSLYTLYTL